MKPTIQIDSNKSLIKDSSKYVCSILIGKNYLTYALSDIAQSTIYAVKHYSFENKVISKKDFNEILSDGIFNEVGKVKIAIDTLKTTLIPAEYYLEEKKSSYLELFHSLSNEEHIKANQLKQDFVSVFSLKKTTVAFLEAILQNVSFYDASACLLQNYPSLLQNDELHTIFICMKPDFVTISIYAQKKLRYHQLFPEVGLTDIIYHVTNYLTVHNINKDQSFIQLNGESTSLGDLELELKKYYPTVRYCTRVQHFEFPEALLSQPTHYFFNLFSLVACE